MSAILAPAGLVPLDAPLPAPREYDLLAAATIINPSSDRFLGGGWIGGYPPGPAGTHDPCSSGSMRVKDPAGDMGRQMAGAFTVYLAGECTAQAVGPDESWLTDRLKLAFNVYEGAAVERVLATGDGHSTLGAYLGDTNMDALNSGGATDPQYALSLLEDQIALNGNGIIHAPPSVVTAWASNYLVIQSRGQLRTALGTLVAAGPGYIGVTPEGQSAGSSGQAWAFASGPIALTRSDVFLNPTDYAQALDRSVNDLVFFAERHYLIQWMARQDPTDDGHTQAGVLVDYSP